MNWDFSFRKRRIGAACGHKTVFLITPAEQSAKVILFLALDDASFITGDTLFVDGGWLARKRM
tara:strand:- start:145 stop:333 length:189 start_codon:yes stop_codon:yes gene_type:complete